MINTIYLPEIREMLSEGNESGLREFCTALHPARTADYMQGLEPEEIWEVLKYAEPQLRSQIFSYIEHDKQVALVEEQDRHEVADLIEDLAPDDRVDMLDDVSEEVVDELMPLLPTEERRDILRLQQYEEDTAGAIMTTEMAKLPESLTVRQAFEELSHQAAELETIYYIYVVDERDHLRGVVSARQLVSKLARPDTPLSDLMDTDIVVAHVDEDQEEVARKVARFDLLAIPVVDREYRLAGIITHDDVIDVFREEATEDAHRIAAVDPLEESYMKTRLFTLSWKRGLWLTILFFTGSLTAILMKHYEGVQLQLEWLAWFVPLIISSGGNSGSQSATLIITAMATGDIRSHDWARVVWRELLSGLMLGSFLGVIGFFGAWAILGNPVHALILPATLLLVVTCGTLSGSILPLTFRRLGLDPALMSNPFVACIIDVLGIVIYMRIALAFLHEGIT
jgi:magnesium transporter